MTVRAISRHFVLFSTADWDCRYWTNKQHVASRLASQGAHVLYVESIGIRAPAWNRGDAWRIVKRLWRGLRGVRHVNERIWVLSPLTIPVGHRFVLARRYNNWLMHNRIRSWLYHVGAERPLAWTYHPFMLEVAAAIRAELIVYHCVDDLGSIPGIDSAAFQEAERKLLASAHCIFATSPALHRRCAETAPTRTHYSPNVADIEHFARARHPGPLPRDLDLIPSPRLGYVGALADFKTDFGLLATVAAARPNWHFVLIGDVWEGEATSKLMSLRELPNVHHLGWRPYGRLPDYLRGIDVALLPQRANEYTTAMFPMKFFEYLAAGCPVVATPLPALEGFQAIHQVANDTNGFIVAIEAALTSKVSHMLPADHAVLQAHSWNTRMSTMIATIEDHIRLAG